MISTFVATLAPIVNCVQLFPQLYKTYQTKQVRDLSVYSLLLLLTTNLLWFTHGYFILDVSLMVSGGISLLVNSFLLFLYFVYH
jgi:uncharacterized protein with PQ loop repeat